MNSLDSIIDLVRSLGGIFLAVFYVAIVLWTYKDARRRIDDPILVATAVATSMLPIVGVLVYMLLRPPEYIADVRERELEIRAMERSLGRQERCPYCKSHIEGNYLSCPVCMTKLRQACVGCEKPLDPKWAMCPFCETEVPRSQRESGRGGRGGAARPGAARPAADTGRPARAAADTGRPAGRPEPKRDSRPAGNTRTASKPRDEQPRRTPRPEGKRPGDTEPFNSVSRSPRFVPGGSERPGGSAPERPTMVTPGPRPGTDRT